MNDEEIQNVIKYKTVWWRELRRIQKLAKEKEEGQPSTAFTGNEEFVFNPILCRPVA